MQKLLVVMAVLLGGCGGPVIQPMVDGGGPQGDAADPHEIEITGTPYCDDFRLTIACAGEGETACLIGPTQCWRSGMFCRDGVVSCNVGRPVCVPVGECR